MKKVGVIAAAAFVWCAALAAAPKSDPPPSWAFIVLQDESDPPPASKLITVPGSELHVTEKAVDDPYAVTDWFPEDHPSMPQVVAHGRRPHLWACGYCHMATGIGDPASVALAGLPAGYIVQQLAEFRAGRRQCAVAKTACAVAMPQVARVMSAADAITAGLFL